MWATDKGTDNTFIIQPHSTLETHLWSHIRLLHMDTLMFIQYLHSNCVDMSVKWQWCRWNT